METISNFILGWLKPLMFLVILAILVCFGVAIFGLTVGFNAPFGTFLAMAAWFAAATVIRSKA